MDHGSDVFGTLRWGLRKYAWVVVGFVVGIGVLLPVVQAQTSDVYEATAVVHPTKLNQDIIQSLPKYGEATFDNGEVESRVREQLDQSADDAVIPQKVELVAEQDNVLFTVIGRDGDAETAQMLANNAAVVFAQQMSRSDAIGSFVVQNRADLPAEPVPTLGGGMVALAVGLIAGAIAGVGAVALLLVWRRPVLDAATAEEATGTPVLGRVTLPRSRRAGGEREAIGVTALARHLLMAPSSLVLVASPPKAAAQRHQLLSVLASVLTGSRQVVTLQGGDLDPTAQDGLAGTRRARGGKVRRQQELVLVDGPTPLEQTSRPEGVTLLLVVPDGISLAALQQAAHAHLDGGAAGLVIVRRGGWWRPPRPWSTRSRPVKPTQPPADQDGSLFDSLTGSERYDQSTHSDDGAANGHDPRLRSPVR